MAKRKQEATEAKRKKARQQKDAQLASGLFNADVQDRNDWDNAEQDYEMVPRTVTASAPVVEGLPIKRADGKIERVVRELKPSEEEEKRLAAVEKESEEVPEEEPLQAEAPKEDEDAHLSPRERLVKIKERVADYASRLIEDPEENMACLTRLRKMCESENVVECQLALMALIPVFKSLAPSYRIRPLSETEKREKVTKEVARLREFEQALVTNYIAYVKLLGKMAKVSRMNSANNKSVNEDDVKKGQLAAKAACELCLSSLRHFNMREDLFSIVARRLNRKPSDPSDYEIFTKCLRVLETLVKEDEQNGDITSDVVRILCKSIRDKQFRVDESVVNIFLSLALLDDYDPNSNKDVPKPKLKKKDRVHLSKKERKARKERKEIDEEMRKAEQAITAEEREKHQALVLRLLLKLYLEILRAGSHGVDAGKDDAALLMAAVLEGLARYGQMANFDLLGDFLEVLREIMTDIMSEHSLAVPQDIADDETGGNFNSRQIRTVLLCVVTSFALVLNHLATGKLPMSVDLVKFVSTLYGVLADMSLDPDLEFSHKSLRLADPLLASQVAEKPSVNVSTESELLLRGLDCVFFRSRNGTVPRATAFTKRLYVSILQTPEKTSLALLKFVGKLTGRFGESLKGLWNTEERISGEGSYILGTERTDREVELERSNAGAATLWENVLLENHYCPMVRDGARLLMKNSKSAN